MHCLNPIELRVFQAIGQSFHIFLTLSFFFGQDFARPWGHELKTVNSGDVSRVVCTAASFRSVIST